MDRITTTDIAKRLGISRGTVSKALNGRSRVDKRTIRMVQKTADEMGYKNPKTNLFPFAFDKTLSILMQDNKFGNPYWAVFIKGFETEAASKGYKYTINVINAYEESSLLLPKSFTASPPSGVAAIGPISEVYYRRLQSSKIPAVYVDTTRNINDAAILGDTLLMCNREHVYEMTSHLTGQGHKNLGFITSYGDCRSFYERWTGFCDALAAADLPVLDQFVFGLRQGEEIESIRQWITSLKGFPTAFVCANDFFAMTVKAALNEAGLDVPKDLALCGFDNDPTLSVLYPELTTADSSTEYVGKRAVQKLFWRLANPEAPYEVIKITSNIYYRDSTEGYVF